MSTTNARQLNQVHIVGTGPGGAEWLPEGARRLIASCPSFAGGRRLLQLAPAGTETFAIGADLEGLRRFVAAQLKRGDVCVLASGDPGCFGILAFLRQHFAGRLKVWPAVSSVQLLAARLGRPWQDWRLKSVHGRGTALALEPVTEPTVYFCDNRNTPQALAQILLQQGAELRVAVGANLGAESETLWQGSLAAAAAGDWPGNALLLLLPPEPAVAELPDVSAPGIPDELWLRRPGVPLSKSEFRAVVLAKAQPRGRSVIWDVGAGTGSYGVECSLLEPPARVIAIDQNPESCALVLANARRFGARVESVCATAPDAFAGLPAPDLVIIGGSDGRLEAILSAAVQRLRPDGRLLATAVLAATQERAPALFAQSGLINLQSTRVAISRRQGEEWLDNNPVVVYTGDSQ